VAGKKSLKDFAGAFEWLRKAGLLYQVHTVDSTPYPLALAQEESQFKTFQYDVGILGASLNISYERYKQYDFTYKGFLAENFVLQEMMTQGFFQNQIFCYRKRESEIEFIYDGKESLVAVEVKAGLSTKSKNLDKNQTKRIKDYPLFLCGYFLSS